VKRHRSSLPFSQHIGRNVLQVLLPILYDGKLKRNADLRGGKSDARSVAHGFTHEFDKLLDLGTANLVRAQRSRFLPKYLLTHL
jgi:hypothetical protein